MYVTSVCTCICVVNAIAIQESVSLVENDMQPSTLKVSTKYNYSLSKYNHLFRFHSRKWSKELPKYFLTSKIISEGTVLSVLVIKRLRNSLVNDQSQASYLTVVLIIGCSSSRGPAAANVPRGSQPPPRLITQPEHTAVKADCGEYCWCMG